MKFMKKVSRKAIELHLVQRDGLHDDSLKLITPGIYETASWRVSDATADSLVNGKIFLHRGQKERSYIDGTILGWVHVEGGRKRFRFSSEPREEGFYQKDGWGNEKCIIWD